MTKSQTETYRTALAAAREAFAENTRLLSIREQEVRDLTDEIARLRRTITALSAMCSEEPHIDQLGITDSVLSVMNEATSQMRTSNVVSALDAMGFDLASQKNANASVHTVLQRLTRQGKIKRVQDEEGPARWTGPNYDPSAVSFDDDIPF